MDICGHPPNGDLSLKKRRLKYIKRELTIALEQFDFSDPFVATTSLGGPNTPRSLRLGRMRS